MAKQRILAICIAGTLLGGVLSGCSISTGKTISFPLKSGDKVQVKMDTTGGYKLKKSDTIGDGFVVYAADDKNKDSVLFGSFEEDNWDNAVEISSEVPGYISMLGDNTYFIDDDDARIHSYYTKISDDVMAYMTVAEDAPDNIIDRLEFSVNDDTIIKPASGLKPFQSVKEETDYTEENTIEAEEEQDAGEEINIENITEQIYSDLPEKELEKQEFIVDVEDGDNAIVLIDTSQGYTAEQNGDVIVFKNKNRKYAGELKVTARESNNDQDTISAALLGFSMTGEKTKVDDGSDKHVYMHNETGYAFVNILSEKSVATLETTEKDKEIINLISYRCAGNTINPSKPEGDIEITQNADKEEKEYPAEIDATEQKESSLLGKFNGTDFYPGISATIFTDDGWKSDGEEGKYSFVELENNKYDDGVLQLYPKDTKKNATMEDVLAGVHGYYMNVGECDGALPDASWNGITWGASADEIKEKYGEPTSVHEGVLYTSYAYTFPGKDKIEFFVWNPGKGEIDGLGGVQYLEFSN